MYARGSSQMPCPRALQPSRPTQDSGAVCGASTRRPVFLQGSRSLCPSLSQKQ